MNIKDQDKIICSCANLSERQIIEYFGNKNNKNVTFEKFLNETRAGTFCTACRLDLETIFIKKNIKNTNFNLINGETGLSMKKKFYNFIDSILPRISIKNQNFFPILNIKNKNLKQEVWITNMEIISSNLKDKIKIDDVEITINLFDSKGKKIWSNHDVVKINKRGVFKIPSEKLLIEKEEIISVGWIEVLRKFKINCSKGTTKPQIMVYTGESSCAVHGQDIGYTKGGGHSSIYRPNVDNQILTFFNPTEKSVEININEPIEIGLTSPNINKKDVVKIKVPAKGSIIYNLNDDRRFDKLFDKYFSISWSGVGKYKTHFYCFSKNYKFVSLDHL